MAQDYDIAHSWEEPEGLHLLLEEIRERRPGADLRKIRYAYFTAERAHHGQSRQSGEPYITHPLAVAQILAGLRMDDDTICAALLHDTIEDCEAVRAEEIGVTFGKDVQGLVEGVTKLRFKDMPGVTPRQRAAAESSRAAESLRKMLLAMARDMRVMVIKLADRLHNMRTLDGLPPDKRTRIANETLDVYAPLAARLGIWQIKWQLEDLAFKHLHPREYQQVIELVAKSRDARERELSEAIVQVKERLEWRGVRGAEVTGRPKHLYSIFNKIVKQGFHFDEIMDLLACRIIVQEVSECYLALGVVHDLWVPVPGLFIDHIAKPKPNGYQSLHTKVMGPKGEPIEIQIRTRRMHEIAEFGVAAHWSYKEGTGQPDGANRFSELREQLFDWSSDHRTSSDFLRTLSSDLFSEQVFAFTPKGDVIDLPAGSTPVDFAFRVHSNLGLTLVGAKVNGSMAPLNTKLKNGDVVELITRSNAQPSLDWLEFVKSAHTRSKLRHYFRKRDKGDSAVRGRAALERELKTLGLEPREYLGEERLNQISKDFRDCRDGTDLLARVGQGLTTVQSVIVKLRGGAEQAQGRETIQVGKSREGKVMLVTAGVDNVMLRRAKCCDPLPEDDVVGYITRGKGIMIHRRVCPNALNFLQTEPERLVPLDWPPDGSPYGVNIRIVTMNRQGLLMDIATVFGESKTNVSGARIRTLPNQTAELDMAIDVTDTGHLTQVMNKIANFSDVLSILRVFGRTAVK
jgi:GTP pyrophosphokinase